MARLTNRLHDELRRKEGCTSSVTDMQPFCFEVRDENVAGDSDCVSQSKMTRVCPFAVINAKQEYDAFLTTPRQVVHQALLRCGYLEELL